MLQLGLGGGGVALLFFKMLTNPESLMPHNLENRFGIFVEISRNVLSSLKALISKNKQQKTENALPRVILWWLLNVFSLDALN